ncbi:MAG: GNAT family N-acetyltransferase [bacterium]|nr:GNAT family N-acetyltransferase [bacterium]
MNDFLIYKDKVAKEFSRLKSFTNIEDAFLNSIKLKNGLGQLIPICKYHLKDNDVIKKLCNWRINNQFAYSVKFNITCDSTRKWLKNGLLDVDDRISFLIINENNKKIGHIGYNHCFRKDKGFEIDGVLRGVINTSPGIMEESLSMIIEWAKLKFSPAYIDLMVLKDNIHAVNFYLKNNFRTIKEYPLYKHEQDGYISYIESKEKEKENIPKDNAFLMMVLSKHKKQ